MRTTARHLRHGLNRRPMHKDERVNTTVDRMFNEVVGQPCTRKEVGSMRSLSLGFGDEAPADSKKRNRHYRVWEMGTYGANWRITNGSVVLLSKDGEAGEAELDVRLQLIDIGRFSAIRQRSGTDLTLEFDNGVAVDLFGDASTNDEYFHLFCPKKLYAEFSQAGWRVGRSDEPWTEGANYLI
jgi:hypothetical protein